MKTLLLINDILWIITAICCIFFEHHIITIIVVITTIVYAVDLWFKFVKMNYKFKPFFKKHWLDILFLIPICKLFRGFHIIKVGKLLRTMDAINDLSEIIFRFRNAIRKIKGNRK